MSLERSKWTASWKGRQQQGVQFPHAILEFVTQEWNEWDNVVLLWATSGLASFQRQLWEISNKKMISDSIYFLCIRLCLNILMQIYICFYSSVFKNSDPLCQLVRPSSSVCSTVILFLFQSLVSSGSWLDKLANMNWIELNYWHLIVVTINIWTFSTLLFCFVLCCMSWSRNICRNDLVCFLLFKIHWLWFEWTVRHCCQNINLRSKKSGY